MKKIEEVTLLYEISKALNEHLELKKSLYKVLSILSDSMNMIRGTITLLNPLRNEISIEVAHGLSKTAIERVKYKLGEGITGRVIETGKSVAIPKISEEPLFLDRTDSRRIKQEFSYFCVPIKKGNQIIGALSADRPYVNNYSLNNGTELLTVVATMVARHVINLENIRLEKERLRNENRRLKRELENKYRINNIIGNSNKMREVFQMITQVSKSNATVLIRGESGTGKELVANSIHYNSNRAKSPFVKMNCAALPANLIESELFGHEKGAFTGAIRQKPGKFEMANKGTIFLDEIGSITPDVQVNLLRVLQEREFERIGGHKTIRTDVRVVAATNKNLENAVEDDSFRGDLYYRLNVFPIYMPPLRERKTDILMLADHFLEKYANENSKDIRRFSTPAIDMLMDYHWPGNVRELENCIERAVLLCEEGVIHSYHLPPTLQTGRESDTLPDLSLDEAIASLEREMIIDALKNTRGNITQSAKILKATVRKVAYKAKKYGIEYFHYR
ncbi:sigma-54-dependent Fis family transcriptional re gulator [Desulfonema ishimotonii]|uniref:Sigma-54-dependent Fis family transcriptional re gulator n=1 Tax=Desulfonema ishimotonii TaxID=45657 RepID=A0A401G0T1_9BACT|nr:sigma 54-interacting transcriptional regulator [Desulfonema ishimotonii]GBC62838.1 sigma-54-dependent Fis family transcriptional re gulator [Desulfonema ishimotonii]